ncbi:MAG: class I SAM-dependent methyltransferase [Pirellulaceae bacterium]
MSLPRINEPEVMQTLAEAQEYDAIDHSETNRSFVEDLLATGKMKSDVLDLGTGTALIPIELCQRHEDCRIMAVDLSTSMLDLARYNIEIAGLIDRIMLDYADAKELPHADEYFDVVICNGMLHHFADPLVVLRQAVRVARSDGLLFFRDLRRPNNEDELTRLLDEYAGEATERQRNLFADSLRAALTLDEMRELVQPSGFDAETVQTTSDRHWTWIARKPVAETAET